MSWIAQMTEIFVDSNVFLRFFMQDDPHQTQAAERIFLKAVNKKIGLVTGPPVFFEVAWTLGAAAKWPNAKILEALEAMASIPGLKLIDEDLVIEAILLAKESDQGFADAYITATAKKRSSKVATFNQKHFKKLGADLYSFD